MKAFDTQVANDYQVRSETKNGITELARVPGILDSAKGARHETSMIRAWIYHLKGGRIRLTCQGRLKDHHIEGNGCELGERHDAPGLPSRHLAGRRSPGKAAATHVPNPRGSRCDAECLESRDLDALGSKE